MWNLETIWVIIRFASHEAHELIYTYRNSTAGNTVTTNDKSVRVNQYQIMQKTLNSLDLKAPHPPQRNGTVSKKLLKNWLLSIRSNVGKSTNVTKRSVFAFCFLWVGIGFLNSLQTAAACPPFLLCLCLHVGCVLCVPQTTAISANHSSAARKATVLLPIPCQIVLPVWVVQS